MYSVNRNLTPAELIERMKASARPFPTSPDASIPTCRIPESASDLQLSECNCTTQTCGAGLAHAPGAIEAALRPVAVVSAPSSAAAGETVVLAGAGSLGADGRTISGYEWSLVSGATSLSALAGGQTSFVAPAGGAAVVVRLTVVDDSGQRDSTDATVQVLGTTPTPPPAPPPAPPPPTPDPGGLSRGGGGGPFDPLALALAAALGWRLRRRRLARLTRD
jgi:serine protease